MSSEFLTEENINIVNKRLEFVYSDSLTVLTR